MLIEKRDVHCPKDHGNRTGSSWWQKVPRKRNAEIAQICTIAHNLRHELFADFDPVDEDRYVARRQCHSLLSKGKVLVIDHWLFDRDLLTSHGKPAVTKVKPQLSVSAPR